MLLPRGRSVRPRHAANLESALQGSTGTPPPPVRGTRPGQRWASAPAAPRRSTVTVKGTHPPAVDVRPPAVRCAHDDGRPVQSHRRASHAAGYGRGVHAQRGGAAGRRARRPGCAQHRAAPQRGGGWDCWGSPCPPKTAAPVWTPWPRSSSTTSCPRAIRASALAYLAHSMLFVNNFYHCCQRRAAGARYLRQGDLRRLGRRHGHDRARGRHRCARR